MVEAAKESLKQDREKELEAVRLQRASDAENMRVLRERAKDVGEVNGEREGEGDGSE